MTAKSARSEAPLPRWRQTLDLIGWFMVDQWFVIAMALLIVIASQVQVPADRQQLKQTIVTYLSVAIIFFITGCTLKTRILIDNYQRWKVHLYVQFQCFFVTSAIVFGVVSAAATNENFMDPALLIGMIFLGVVPTTLSSNVIMTRQAHGNAALTVVQTTIGNFIGPFLSPVLIKMYTSSGAWYTDYLIKAEAAGGGFGEVYRRVFMQLGFSVYLPMVVGQVLQNLFPAACDRVFNVWSLRKMGSLALLSVIWQTFDQAFATGAFSSVKPSNIIFIVFMNIAFFLIWLGVSFVTSTPWLSRKDVVSVLYCVPAKTPAMGVPLTNVMFAALPLVTESKMQIPMILFQGLQITLSSLMTIPLRKWVDQLERDSATQDGSKTQVGATEAIAEEWRENVKVEVSTENPLTDGSGEGRVSEHRTSDETRSLGLCEHDLEKQT